MPAMDKKQRKKIEKSVGYLEMIVICFFGFGVICTVCKDFLIPFWLVSMP